MKLKCFIALFLVIQCTCSAQAIRTVGIKAGIVTASQSWDYTSPFANLETEHRWGVDVGLFAEWLNIPMFSFTSEVHYIQKGMKTSLLVTTEANPDGNGEHRTFSLRVDYLSIPVLTKVRFTDGEVLPYIVAGPRFDLLLQTSGEGFFQATLDKFEKIDFGATIGVGLEIKSLEPIHLGVEFRFSPSFKDGYSSSFMKVRNSSMEFLLVAGI